MRPHKSALRCALCVRPMRYHFYLCACALLLGSLSAICVTPPSPMKAKGSVSRGDEGCGGRSCQLGRMVCSRIVSRRLPTMTHVAAALHVAGTFGRGVGGVPAFRLCNTAATHCLRHLTLNLRPGPTAHDATLPPPSTHPSTQTPKPHNLQR